jgi:hypothetical protein
VRTNAQRRASDYEKFARFWGVPPLESLSESEAVRSAIEVAITAWTRRHSAAQRAKVGYGGAQVLAPIAAGTATVLASTTISAWAVVPSAVATIASSMLAAFGFRDSWFRLRWLAREIGFEIVEFAMGYGDYRGLDDPQRIDRLMARLDHLSMRMPSNPGTPRAN